MPDAAVLLPRPLQGRVCSVSGVAPERWLATGWACFQLKG